MCACVCVRVCVCVCMCVCVENGMQAGRASRHSPEGQESKAVVTPKVSQPLVQTHRDAVRRVEVRVCSASCYLYE